MLKKIFLFLLLGVQFYAVSQTQVIAATRISAVTIDADMYIGNDNLGYFYYIKNNILYKQNDEQQWQYQNVSLADISKVDIINPLKIVVFYQNFNKVVLLDNQLNEVSVIDFSQANDQILASAVGMSGQNNLWIYNDLYQQFGLFNYETRKYVLLNQPLKNTFTSYQSDFNSLVWVDDKLVVSQIDPFGKVETLDIVKAFDSIFYISNQGFLFTKNNILYYAKINSDQKIVTKISEKSIRNFTYKDKILTIFTGAEIIKYNLNLP